jgi:hypothetical protein
MGQKSNPNSFQKNTQIVFKYGDSSNISEYSTLFKENFSILTALKFFFEKKRCLIKNCFVIVNNEKSFMTIFVSFFVLRRSLRSKLNNIKKENVKKKKTIVPFAQKFLNVLNKFGYLCSKRLVLQNLNKIALKQQKTRFFSNHSLLKKKFDLFKREIYFDSGLMLICLLKSTRKTSFLISKFIAFFFKMFHRTTKINKFLFFLTKFVEALGSLKFNDNCVKGIKIQIKGRFKGAPRSKIRLFSKGSIPLQTIISNIDYSLVHVQTSYGIFSIKVWIFE